MQVGIGLRIVAGIALLAVSGAALMGAWGANIHAVPAANGHGFYVVNSITGEIKSCWGGITTPLLCSSEADLPAIATRHQEASPSQEPPGVSPDNFFRQFGPAR